MKNILYGVYGASGFGREVIPLARSQLRKNGIDLNQLVFIDDKASASTVNGFAVLSYASFMDIPVNIYSYVAHDCVIGDFVTFAPGVKCNGNVHIQDNVYVGTGAIIKQGKPGKPIVIESGAVIGMGAVVTKSVSAGETVIGNPAKPLSRDALRK